jgi:hypothetical protein
MVCLLLWPRKPFVADRLCCFHGISRHCSCHLLSLSQRVVERCILHNFGQAHDLFLHTLLHAPPRKYQQQLRTPAVARLNYEQCRCNCRFGLTTLNHLKQHSQHRSPKARLRAYMRTLLALDKLTEYSYGFHHVDQGNFSRLAFGKPHGALPNPSDRSARQRGHQPSAAHGLCGCHQDPRAHHRVAQ